MRELMLGARRFNDLKASLGGISANVLTQRLSELEAAGVVRRAKLPPPASIQVYELTGWGREAEKVVLELGRWGARSPLQDVTMPLSSVSMVLSFRAMFRPERAKGVAVTVVLRVPEDEEFTLRVEHERLETARGVSAAFDVAITGAPGAIARAVYGIEPLDMLERQCQIGLQGDRDAFGRFARCFSLPEKAG